VEGNHDRACHAASNDAHYSTGVRGRQRIGRGCHGDRPCTWTTTGLPAGLTATTAGQIVGTPTTAGIYHVSITVKDTRNVSSPPATFTWTINAQ
jgi:hypothetical protein